MPPAYSHLRPDNALVKSSLSHQPQQLLDMVVRILGEDFVRYGLAIDADRPLLAGGLTTGQLEALGPLHDVAVRWEFHPSLVHQTAMGIFGSVPPDMDTSLINVIRRTAGGDLEVAASSGDTVVDGFVEVARHSWPLFLSRPEAGIPGFQMSIRPDFHLPGKTELLKAFLADESLMKLFPIQPDASCPSDPHSRAFGYLSSVCTRSNGASLQLITLVDEIVIHAVTRCRLEHRELDLKRLVPHIKQAVFDLRTLAEGDQVEIPQLIALGSLDMEQGCSVQLAGMLLRPLQEADREFFPDGMAQVGAVLESTETTAIVAVHSHDEGAEIHEHSESTIEAYRERTREVDLVRLSLLLADRSSSGLRAHEVARVSPGNWLFGGSTVWNPASMRCMQGTLTCAEAGVVREWHRLVTVHHHASLDVARRRLLAAATVRTDPIDAFVDAVVVWESLFGTHSEVTFRVTASIGRLIEPSDVQARRQLVKELKDLYSMRSKLVHGGPEPEPHVIEAGRDRTIEVAVKCLRALYRDRPDLIPMTSTERSNRILLD